MGFGGEGSKSGNSKSGGGRGDEFTTIGGEFGRWSGDLSVGRKGGNRGDNKGKDGSDLQGEVYNLI
jgi:hypothetical protein